MRWTHTTAVSATIDFGQSANTFKLKNNKMVTDSEDNENVVLTDWLAVVQVTGNWCASGIEPILIIGSQFLVDGGLHKIAPFGHLQFTWPGVNNNNKLSTCQNEKNNDPKTLHSLFEESGQSDHKFTLVYVLDANRFDLGVHVVCRSIQKKDSSNKSRRSRQTEKTRRKERKMQSKNISTYSRRLYWLLPTQNKV